MSANRSNEIKFLQWNCQSLLPKVAAFRTLLCQEKIDVFGLCETWLLQSDTFVVPNYVIFTSCQPTRRRGLALGLHRSLPNVTQLTQAPDLGEIELLVAAVSLGSEIYRFATVYIPPASEYSLTRSGCMRLLSSASAPFVIMGDLNAHHQLWGCATTDNRGRLLQEVVEELGLTVVNDGSITRIARPPMRPSAIDLTICSPSLSLSTSWRVLEDRFGSDHYPTVSTLTFERDTLTRSRRRRQADLTKNIDWNRFGEEVKSKLPELVGLPFETRFASFRDFLVTEDTAWSYGGAAPWWDGEVQAAHREARRAEHSFRREGTEEAFDLMRSAQSSFQRLRHRKKQQSWREYCETFDEHTPLSELFAAARRYRNRGSASDAGISDET